MKRTLFLSLAMLSTALSAYAASASDYTLGDVMYVGDSITHGVNAPSYRWAMHKILVDNGISYDEVGYRTGNASNGVAAGTTYGGVSFKNTHSSQSSARAFEIAGRSTKGRFDDTNLLNWLGLSSTKTNGQTYTGPTFTGDDTPETFVLLIGTNDLLSESGGIDNATNLANKTNLLLGADKKSGDMGTIADTMYKANANAKVYVSTIPCWTEHKNSGTEAYHSAAQTYNENLKTWVSNYNSANNTNIVLMDANRGIIDVAASTSFYGVRSMFNAPGTSSTSDGLHPNRQGDLIMAANFARAMGLAGRTAGQERVAAADFSLTVSAADTGGVTLSNVSTSEGVLDFSASGTSSLSQNWENAGSENGGFTVELGDWHIGNGSTDGWNTTDNLSIVLGNDSFYGTLNINEAYIQWGSTILYSEDMSCLGNQEALRVAYLSGSATEGVSEGFYVWLGDMLIGEALDKTSADGYNGVSLSYSGSGTATLGTFSLNAGASYAPTTNGLYNAEDAFLAKVIQPRPGATPQGNITLPTSYTQTLTPTNSDNNSPFDAMKGVTSAATDKISITANAGTCYFAFGNSTTRTGDIYATFNKGKATTYVAAHGTDKYLAPTSDTLTGNIVLQFTEDYQGGSAVFGVANAGGVTGDVTLVFDAQDAAYAAISQTAGAETSVAATHVGNIGGTFRVVLNAGTFDGNILGGINQGADKTLGKSEVFINGGSIARNVFGGGRAGTIGSPKARSSEPATLVTVTGGVTSGSVYGGGSGGTINGDTCVTITGGTIMGGIYGGGSGGTINGSTSVTIDGNLPLLAGSMISGGGTAGTITGDTRLVIKNAAASDYKDSIDKYTGKLSGGADANVGGTRSLEFDNAKLRGTDFDLATLEDFDIITLRGGSDVLLSSAGGASEIELVSSMLTLQGDSSLIRTITMDTNSALTLSNLVGTAENKVIINILGDNVDLSKLSITLTGNSQADGATLENVYILANGAEYEAIIDWRDTQALSRNVVASYTIPEPTTATLSLLALAGMLARRRRK